MPLKIGVTPKLKASPNGTADVEVARKGTVSTTTKIYESKVLMRTEQTYEALAVDDPGPVHVLVDTGHTVGQSIEYQTVQTTVRVVIPVAVDTKAIKAGFKLAWQVVEEELDARGRWAATTIKSLADLKRDIEGPKNR